MTLEDLRRQVMFHNSIDVWIEYCNEESIPWNDPQEYGKFIAYLLKNNMNLKAFNLCAHEAGDTQIEKKEFAERLANLKVSDRKYATYTIRLGTPAIGMIRAYDKSD